MSIKIYEWNTSTSVFDLKYTADNCDSLDISKSSGIMPFGLPIVDTDQDTSGRLVNEKIDLIRISGIECTISISFEIDISDVKTMLDLVSNDIGMKNKIAIDDWGADLGSDINFIGIIGNIRLRQSDSPRRVSCTITHYEGDNLFYNLDL